ncbi:MAG: hypothetical protein V1822_00445 [Candidatus Micrarchaeota archaeon]
MENDEALRASIRKWAVKCAKQYRFAIPNKVIVNVLKEFPHLQDEGGELMDLVREVCTEVNKMGDKEILREARKIDAGDTTVYE